MPVSEKAIASLAAKIQAEKGVTPEEAVKRARRWAQKTDKRNEERAAAHGKPADPNVCCCPSPRCRKRECVERYAAERRKNDAAYSGSSGNW